MEGREIALGLESEHVVAGEVANQFRVRRQDAQRFDVRKRNVQKESNRYSDAELAQSRAQRNQVIVVNPDEIVGPQQGQKLARKLSVDVLVCIALLRTKAELAGHVVKYRPQGAIRETVVVALEFLATKLHRDVGDAIAHLNIRLSRLTISQLAVPSEPHPAAVSQCGQDSDCETAGGHVPPRE